MSDDTKGTANKVNKLNIGKETISELTGPEADAVVGGARPVQGVGGGATTPISDGCGGGGGQTQLLTTCCYTCQGRGCTQ